MTTTKLFLYVLAFILVSSACGGNGSKKVNSSQVIDKPTASVSNDTASFELDNLPISEVELGEFPYLAPPENYCFNFCSNWDGKAREQDVKELDREFFAVNGKLLSVEGKSYKQTIEKNRNADEKGFSSLFVAKELDKDIRKLGGIKVNQVAVPYSEIERVGKQQLLDYGYSIDFNLLDDIHTYVIRTKDKYVWIQFFVMDGESGRITVLETTDRVG